MYFPVYPTRLTILHATLLELFFYPQSPYKQADGDFEYGLDSPKEEIPWRLSLQSHDR